MTNVDINKVLEQLAIAFNTTVDAIYPILIKQAYVSGIMDLLFGIALILLAVAIATIIYKKWEAIYESDMEFIVVVIALIFSLVAVFIIPISIFSGITTLANPEYWALKDILSRL